MMVITCRINSAVRKTIIYPQKSAKSIHNLNDFFSAVNKKRTSVEIFTTADSTLSLNIIFMTNVRVRDVLFYVIIEIYSVKIYYILIFFLNCGSSMRKFNKRHSKIYNFP